MFSSETLVNSEWNSGIFLFFFICIFLFSCYRFFFFFLKACHFVFVLHLSRFFLRTRFTQWEDIHILGNSSSANISVVEKYFFLFLSSSDIFGIGIWQQNTQGTFFSPLVHIFTGSFLELVAFLSVDASQVSSTNKQIILLKMIRYKNCTEKSEKAASAQISL